MVLIDSDVLIEVIRGRDQQILSRWNELSLSQKAIFYSPVTAAELWAGVRPTELDTLRRVFAALICIPISDETGRQAGDYLRFYRKSHTVEMADALIAATAVLHGKELWTRNRKHFPMKELAFY